MVLIAYIFLKNTFEYIYNNIANIFYDGKQITFIDVEDMAASQKPSGDLKCLRSSVGNLEPHAGVDPGSFTQWVDELIRG